MRHKQQTMLHMKPIWGIWQHTILCNKGGFLYSLCSCNFDDQFSPNFHRFDVRIHQVRILVFDKSMSSTQVYPVFNKDDKSTLKKDPINRKLIKLRGTLLLHEPQDLPASSKDTCTIVTTFEKKNTRSKVTSSIKENYRSCLCLSNTKLIKK